MSVDLFEFLQSERVEMDARGGWRNVELEALFTAVGAISENAVYVTSKPNN